MTAQKKSSTKSVKSPAPATKNNVAKPAARKTSVAPPTAKPQIVAPAPTKPVSVAPVTRVDTPASAVLPVKGKPVVTTITARVDVGFGNSLYLRGEGTGLSWDKGLKMECVGDELWQISLGESARGFTFKFLVNDLAWSAGPDHSTPSGASVTLMPEF